MTSFRLALVAVAAGLLLSGCGADARSAAEVCWDKFGLDNYAYGDLPSVLARIAGVPTFIAEGLFSQFSGAFETISDVVLNILSSFGLC